MTPKEQFIEIYNTHIKRDGADRLLKWLESSDFFTAPASTKYHLAVEGGLCQHSIHVYERLRDLVKREAQYQTYQVTPETEETIAIVALLHDLCKVNFYTTSFRNQKDEHGVWNRVPYYSINDLLPYGHGEKSVYMISSYMHLTREEAFAIRYHMGSWNSEEKQNASKAFEMFPLAFLVHVADEYATFIDEKEVEQCFANMN